MLVLLRSDLDGYYAEVGTWLMNLLVSCTLIYQKAGMTEPTAVRCSNVAIISHQRLIVMALLRGLSLESRTPTQILHS